MRGKGGIDAEDTYIGEKGGTHRKYIRRTDPLTATPFFPVGGVLHVT